MPTLDNAEQTSPPDKIVAQRRKSSAARHVMRREYQPNAERHIAALELLLRQGGRRNGGDSMGVASHLPFPEKSEAKKGGAS